MVRPVRPAHAGSPYCRAKDDHRQEEENAGYLKPQSPSNAAEGAQKAADAAGNTARGLAGDLAGGADLGSSFCGLLGGLIGCGLGAGGHSLAGDASGDAESDTEDAPDGLRLHFDLMVTAWLPTGRSTEYRTDFRTGELLWSGVGSKV